VLLAIPVERRSEDISAKGGRSNAAFPDHLNLSPAYAKARADATIAAKAREAAAWEAQRKEEEITSTAEFIASDIADGGHLLPKRTIIGWRETRDGPPVVETVTIWPLDPAPVVDLLRAGILTHKGYCKHRLEAAIQAHWKVLNGG
jgi:hypothetical protein